ncbi:hypothetical protein [Devosia sp. MC521]|uniref:hypothetical protein n=1 Tax=Devosia sp. MC521 TaxID=2759954 RepID=UPI0015FB6948|nr:hypothetical protein [Devosia sp. MC521]MBJ6988120.1 hypothetical protein [Devosia sp. MC521]QMW63406.1 hypothetical protein H4N61_03445 [Devosia sp. MC521]
MFELAAAKLVWDLDEVKTFDLRAQAVETALSAVEPGARLILALGEGSDSQKLASLLTANGFGRSILTLIENLGQGDEQLRSQMAEFFMLADVGRNAICAVSVVAVPQGAPTSNTTPGPWG